MRNRYRQLQLSLAIMALCFLTSFNLPQWNGWEQVLSWPLHLIFVLALTRSFILVFGGNFFFPYWIALISLILLWEIVEPMWQPHLLNANLITQLDPYIDILVGLVGVLLATTVGNSHRFYLMEQQNV